MGSTAEPDKDGRKQTANVLLDGIPEVAIKDDKRWLIQSDTHPGHFW